MSYQYWSTYDGSSCSGVPSGVFVVKQTSCASQVQTSCVPKKDANGDLIGYVKQSCGAEDLAGLSGLFDGEPYLAVRYFDDIKCSIYGNTAAYRANGKCAALFANQGFYIPVRSAIVGVTNTGLALAVNAGNTTDSLNCPGAADSGYRVYRVSSDANQTHECTTFEDDVVGGFRFYSTVPASDGSGSGFGSSTSTASGSAIVNSGSTLVSSAGASGSSSVNSGLSTSEDVSSSSGSSQSSSSSGGSGVAVGVIVGVAGSVAVVLVAIIAIVCCMWRRSKRNGNSDTRPHREPFINTRTDGTAESDPSMLASGLWNEDAIIAARVPRDKVKVQDLIARGGFGEVYRGTYNREAIAIKVLFPEVRSDLKKVNVFLAEAKLMAGLSHAHIVRFVGVSWDSLNDLCMLTELMQGGDLRSLLKSYDARGHPQGFDSDKIRIAYDVAQALMYLHSLSPVVIHRDLKSKNVLLTNDLTAKLTDFGVSRERQENTMTAGVGTLLWMAPEVMMAERYSEVADIFSFGVLLSELDLQTLPYSHARVDAVTGKKMPDAVILQKVATGDVQVTFSSGCLSSVAQLAQECVSLEPSARPSAPMVVYRLQTIMKDSIRM
ncbi:hypothetical protein PR003_g14596 [Phytophthora rubi]|uniref:Protein kinase domain-containing protein n=1 Tax=Phytophthora rubi TaxID=129364 RepID=A0A6A4EUC2_9STRA|nr:hypothetical protein PR001_g14239 [Phytophthora rubi]KAE9332278.1 hypothetical protein PR003_g14596 [Phytophthora rubi]